MRSTPLMIGVSLLITSSGFAEIPITARDNAVDSDVVLESAVDTVKSIPQDTVNVVGDVVTYVGDEVNTAVKGVKAIAEQDPVRSVERASALKVASAWDASNDIIFRSFDVAPEVGETLVGGAMAQGGTQAVDVSGFFDSVKFPAKTSAYYRPDFHRLFVRQTLDNVLAIEDVLAELHNANRELLGQQVEIEVKFIETNQSTLDELGFQWRFNGKNGDLETVPDLYLPQNTDIFTAGLRRSATALASGTDAGLALISKATGSLRWDVLISALEQDKDTDVLSAPRVVTRDGNTAVIQIGQEQMLPQGFDVNNQEISAYVEHTDWDTQLLGVQLEVTPELREGDLIDLEIIPKVREIAGWDNYEVLPAWSDEVNTVDTPQIGSLPYLRIREMETRMTVADGSTVGMGGLVYDKVETFKDKVPVLGSIPFVGRFFRSEGEKNVKRDLMVFVKASQVDLNGRTTADISLNN